ncbi:MAG: glycosyltransferase family 4 protein [Patescibacteria group bacterium]
MPSVKISTGFSELLPVKNIAGVIRAIPENAELWIVGDGPERNKLEKLAKQLDKKTIFFGRVDNQKARKLMSQSDIFVLNSFHEGMPHALLEALAEGVPIIATRIPAITEILTDKVTGLFVNVDDPEDLAKKISEIENYPKLTENGRKLFEEKFTWNSHLSKLRDIFDNIS